MSGAGKTNTLAVTGLQREFFHDSVLSALREHFETFGSLVHWVALPSFGRILVIYEYEADAEKAKLVSDPIVLGGSDSRSEITMRVYRADHTPLDALNGTTAEGRYLLPPTTDKNFLISPPGSPPVGWEPIREDPPNAAPLADDLIMALKKLQIEQRHRRGGSVDGNGGRGSVEVLLEPDDVIGVGVYVENCDEEEDGNDAGGGMLGDGWGAEKRRKSGSQDW